MTVRFYSSVAAETTLVNSITNVSTSIIVGSVTGYPVSFPYVLALDYESATEELVTVTAAAGTTLTITRAYDSTSAVAHNAGARVRHTSSAQDFRDSRDHENADDGIHGLAPGDVIVGETETQTLSNKTLTSPIINSATINGTVAGSPAFTGTWTGAALAAAKFRFSNTTDLSLVSTDHAFQIGNDNSQNLRMDNNEIMSVNNGATGTLVIQGEGGVTTFASALAVDNVSQVVNINGTTEGNLFLATRATTAGNAFQCRTDADAQGRWAVRCDGLVTWGSGAGAADVNLYRQAADVLRTDDSLSVGSTLTVSGATTLGTATVTNNLAVTGTANFGVVTGTGPGVVANAAAGFTVDAATKAVTKAGITTVNIVFTRTGADIVAPANNNIPDTLAFALLAGFRPDSNFAGQRMIFSYNFGGVSSGVAGLDPGSGQVELLTLENGSTISTGSTGRITMTYIGP